MTNNDVDTMARNFQKVFLFISKSPMLHYMKKGACSRLPLIKRFETNEKSDTSEPYLHNGNTYPI